MECDDGNLLDGDGCNSLCRIEAGWTCANGDATNPDQCSDVRPVRVALEMLEPDREFHNLDENQPVQMRMRFSRPFSIVGGYSIKDILLLSLGDLSLQFTIEEVNQQQLLRQRRELLTPISAAMPTREL